MTASQKKKDLLQKLPAIVDALKKGYQPEKIILFGSLLDPDRESNDVDLFVVKKTKEDRLGRRAGQARQFLGDRTLPVDFLIYTPIEVSREIERGNVFVRQILEEGKVLYEKTF